MSIESNSGARLHKTAAHIFVETSDLMQGAMDRASEARSAGSSRSRGYASLTVVAVGLIFQSGGLLALGKLGPGSEVLPHAAVATALFSDAEERLISSNLERIQSNATSILATKNRMAPSVPLESNVIAIQSSAQDLQTVMLKAGNAPQTARAGEGIHSTP